MSDHPPTLGQDFPLISVIIPTLNEASAIGLTLASILDSPDTEQIVVDGGSIDGTAEVARSWGARVVYSSPGRGRQMNEGARQAAGKYLVFLHSDTRLSPGFVEHIRSTLSLPGIVAGAFRLRIDSELWAVRLIERVANWRSRRLQLPYGDQAIFLKTETFIQIGGFSDLPIMEDFELVRRLRKKGRIVIAPALAITSARRWQRLGPVRTTLINQLVILAFFAGVNPASLARWYHGNGQ